MNNLEKKNPNLRKIAKNERFKVGRAEKDYSTHYKLLKTLKRENRLWLFPLSSLSFGLLMVWFAYNRMVDDILNSPLYRLLPEPEAILEILFHAGFVLIAPIIAKISLNVVFAKLLERGISLQKPLLNLFSGVLVALSACAYFYAYFFESVWRFFANLVTQLEGLGQLGNVGVNLPALPSFSEVFQIFLAVDLKYQIIAVAVLLSSVAYMVVFVALLVTLVQNAVRGVMVAFKTTRKLPENRFVGEDLLFTNFHPLDYDELQDIYIRTSRWNNELTVGQFKSYATENVISNSRVLMRKGAPIGYYLLNENRDTIVDVKLHRYEHDKNLVPPILEDFETNARKSGLKRIDVKINPRKDDLGLLSYLKSSNWKSTATTNEEETFSKNLFNAEVRMGIRRN